MPENQRLTVSFVSGKGGVGKTMLAVAFAREISRNARALLIDLDFFNRGLTGLMRHGKNIMPLAPPQFVNSGSQGQLAEKWQLVEIAPNLFHIRYPDLLPDQILGLEQTPISKLVEALKQYLEYVRDVSGCDIVVMDCHGGPDQLSFAACFVSDYSLMISEPDKITFYGTLHFVRQLERVAPASAQKPDLRLIFNKVVPAFSVPYLNRFYEDQIKEYFGNHELLAVFPLEIYLTKEFERTPFLTAVYPFSQLTKKTRVYSRDLLIAKFPKMGFAATPAKSRLRLWMTRHWLGRIPPIIDLNYVMAAIAVGAVIFAAVFFYTSKLILPKYSQSRAAVETIEMFDYIQAHPESLPSGCKNLPDWHNTRGCLVKTYHYSILMRQSERGLGHFILAAGSLVAREDLKHSTDPEIKAAYDAVHVIPLHDRVIVSIYYHIDMESDLLAGGALIWFLTALILNWSIALDRVFTYDLRRRHRFVAIMVFFTALAVWCGPLAALGGIANDALRYGGGPAFSMITACAVSLTLVTMDQLFKSLQNLRFEKRVTEAMARLVFAMYIVIFPTAIAFLAR